MGNKLHGKMFDGTDIPDIESQAGENEVAAKVLNLDEVDFRKDRMRVIENIRNAFDLLNPSSRFGVISSYVTGSNFPPQKVWTKMTLGEIIESGLQIPTDQIESKFDGSTLPEMLVLIRDNFKEVNIAFTGGSFEELTLKELMDTLIDHVSEYRYVREDISDRARAAVLNALDDA